MEFSLNNRKLKYEDDKMFIWCDSGTYKKNPKYKEISLWNNRDRKYVTIDGKSYQYHRVLGYVFLGLDIEDNKQVIIHLDGNKQNNTLSNLQLVPHSHIHHNRKNIKGYYKCNKTEKFKTQICINGTIKYLGSYDTEEEARRVYLEERASINSLASSSVQKTIT